MNVSAYTHDAPGLSGPAEDAQLDRNEQVASEAIADLTLLPKDRADLVRQIAEKLERAQDESYDY